MSDQNQFLKTRVKTNENLYGRRLVEVPCPQFLIFYNGEEYQPDYQTLKLSSAYTVSKTSPSLELTAIMLNINAGHNQKLLDSCTALGDYAEYTSRVRKYAKHMDIDAAVDLAISECIKEGILREFLMKNRSEAKSMSIYEYDEERHMRQEREASKEEGFLKGEENMARLTELLLKAGRTDELTRALSDREFRKKLYEELGIAGHKVSCGE